jgi:hypothetical protein
MSLKKTFLDAGVLIAAARGKDIEAARAMQVLDDPNREFVSSLFLKLEVLPKAIYEKRGDEARFYETFFEAVTYWAEPDNYLIKDAYQKACKYGLAAMDALHISAAIFARSDEFVTTEKHDKPIHRVKSIKVVSLNPSRRLG